MKKIFDRKWANACNFVKINTPPLLHFLIAQTVQIVQRISIVYIFKLTWNFLTKF